MSARPIEFEDGRRELEDGRREREETSCPATALAEGGATLRREDVQW